MNIQQAKKLIDKYFEAETSLQEEQELRKYFAQEDVPEELLPYRPLFTYFSTSAKKQLPKGFEQKVLNELKATNQKQNNTRLLNLFITTAAAAALALFFFLTDIPFAERQKKSKLANSESQIDWEKYQPKSEKEALEETIEALQLLAEKLNSSKKKTSKELRKVGKVTRILEN